MIDDRLWSLIALGLVALGYLLCLLYPLPQVRALLRLPPPEGELRAALRQALGAPRDATDDELLLTVIQAPIQSGRHGLCAGAC